VTLAAPEMTGQLGEAGGGLLFLLLLQLSLPSVSGWRFFECSSAISCFLVLVEEGALGIVQLWLWKKKPRTRRDPSLPVLVEGCQTQQPRFEKKKQYKNDWKLLLLANRWTSNGHDEIRSLVHTYFCMTHKIICSGLLQR
jgi:hypothetical protein